MKKLVITLLFIFSYILVSAQLDFGIKAGLNYNALDDLNINGGFIGLNENVDSEDKLGYHLGIFTQVSFDKLVVRGELLYVNSRSTFDNSFAPSTEFKLSTLELPILVGYEIISPINLYIGPSVIYTIDNEFSNFFDLSFERDVNIAYNIGASLSIKKFGIDFRYTSGFSENLAIYSDDIPVDGFGYSIDTKPRQFLLSVSYQIN